MGVCGVTSLVRTIAEVWPISGYPDARLREKHFHRLPENGPVLKIHGATEALAYLEVGGVLHGPRQQEGVRILETLLLRVVQRISFRGSRPSSD